LPKIGFHVDVNQLCFGNDCIAKQFVIMA